MPLEKHKCDVERCETTIKEREQSESQCRQRMNQKRPKRQRWQRCYWPRHAPCNYANANQPKKIPRPKAELHVKAWLRHRETNSTTRTAVLPRGKITRENKAFLSEKQLADFYHQADGIPHGKSTLTKLQRSVSMRHFSIWPEEAVDISGE